jgi:lysozyme family protein
MTAANFDAALSRVLAHEGGYTNHPSDPGGPTNYGITIADYRKYVKADATAADVRNMTVGDAKKIYRLRYWRELRCDDLPPGVDYATFDYGVNSGTARAGKVLRRLLRLPATTAAIDDDVIAAAGRAEHDRLIIAICEERLAFLQGLKTWPVFGAGWARRVAEVKAAALAMANAQQTRPVGDNKGKIAAAGAVVAAGAAAHQAGLANAGSMLVVIVALLFAMAAGWLVWRKFGNR